MKWWFRQKLYIQIFICIVIGIIVGVVFGEKASIIFPLGDIFMRLLKMLIVPLTFCTLISGMTKMEDIKNLRSVGGRIIIYYTATTMIAASIGMIVALITNPGKGAAGILTQGSEVEVQEFSFINNIVSWVPENIITAMNETNMLQIIFFAIFFGAVLLILGERVKTLINVVDQCTDVMIKMTELVMKFAPYGILTLIAKMVTSLEGTMIKEVGKFILTDYIGLVLILLLAYPTLLKLFAKIKPIKFYKAVSPAMLVAASTTSSNATLPVSMRVARENLKVPEKIYGFTLPLGATVNMDGMANALGVIGVFAFNIYNVPITFTSVFQFVFLGLVLSTGCAGVKGAGIVMSSILLKSLNLLLDLVPIFAAIWPIIDIGHTTLNITGDLTGTAIVSASLGEMNVEEFNNSQISKTKA